MRTQPESTIKNCMAKCFKEFKRKKFPDYHESDDEDDLVREKVKKNVW